VQSLSGADPSLPDPDYPPANYTPDWEFRLASTYPRIEIPFVKDVRIVDVPALQSGANLIAEVTRVGQQGVGDEEDSDDE